MQIRIVQRDLNLDGTTKEFVPIDEKGEPKFFGHVEVRLPNAFDKKHCPHIVPRVSGASFEFRERIEVDAFIEALVKAKEYLPQ